jgi:hypothetical protein
MRPYVVRQGDYLFQLAQRWGFDADEVWNAQENAVLRETRPNPQQLAPGDILQIPEERAPPPSFASGGTRRYRAEVPRVEVRFTLREGLDPLADEPYEVHGVGRETLEGTTDGEGTLSVAVPVTTRQVEIRFPEMRLAVPVLVGGLDPIDTPSGVAQRLANLGMTGFSSQLLDHRSPLPPEQLEELAIRRFQSAYGLAVTGVLDEETRTALDGAHSARITPSPSS